MWVDTSEVLVPPWEREGSSSGVGRHTRGLTISRGNEASLMWVDTSAALQSQRDGPTDSFPKPRGVSPRFDGHRSAWERESSASDVRGHIRERFSQRRGADEGQPWCREVEIVPPLHTRLPQHSQGREVVLSRGGILSHLFTSPRPGMSVEMGSGASIIIMLVPSYSLLGALLMVP